MRPNSKLNRVAHMQRFKPLYALLVEVSGATAAVTANALCRVSLTLLRMEFECAPASKGTFFILQAKTARQKPQTGQPPFLGRLPGFFLLRVDVPRSRLTFWP